MTIYSPSRAYEPQLDVRFTDGVDPSWAVPVVKGQPPNSGCWLVVIPRRGGKSWFAAAVRQSRERDDAGSTTIVDLRGSARAAKSAGVHSLLMGSSKKLLLPQDGVLIIDEPGPAVQGDYVAKFAAGLGKVRAAGVLPVVLLTPGECRMLVPHLEIDAEKDVIVPPELSPVEANRMAARAPQWGTVLLDEIRKSDQQWLKSPFLLELLFHVAEQKSELWKNESALRENVPLLLRTAMDVADSKHQYRVQVLENGLTEQQRADLRAVHWRNAGIDMPVVAADSLVHRTTIPKDPVVQRHLPEILRIHHISDLHHGGTLRVNVDAKDKSPAGGNATKLRS